MVFLVCKGLGRADNNRVARVNTDRVDIFHITYGNRGVVRVPYYLVFNFLVALNALFHQNLMNGGQFEGSAQYFGALPRVIGKAAARAA